MKGRFLRSGGVAVTAIAVMMAVASIGSSPLNVLASQETPRRRRRGGVVTSPLFPGTKLLLQCRPQELSRDFSAPFEAMPGFNGGPVLPVRESLDIGLPNYDLDQPVIGRSWEQDIVAQLLSSVWSASGSNESLTNAELRNISSYIHKEAVARARKSGDVGEAVPDPDDLYYPFERAFCFPNTALEQKGWKEGTGTVCVDIVRPAFRSELGGGVLSENAVVVSVVFPAITSLIRGNGDDRFASLQERIEAVEAIGEKLLEASFYYNTEVVPRVEHLPVLEVLRVAPLPSLEDPPTVVREGDSEDSQSQSFFSMPDDVPIEGAAEGVELARGLLRGLSRGYRRLRNIYISQRKLEKASLRRATRQPTVAEGEVTTGETFQAVRGGEKGSSTPETPQKDTSTRVLQLSQPKLRSVRFPLPIIALSYCNGDFFFEALKAEEAATQQQAQK